MTRSFALLRLASVAALLLVSACATTRRYPAESLPVRLVSSTPFAVHLRARPDTAASSCEVLRITGTVEAVLGDTMAFTRVWSDVRPGTGGDCLAGRPGFVLLSSAPNLQGEVGTPRNARTTLLVVLTGTVTAIATIIVVVLHSLD
jgi:hypothetical protein